jgi:hypothetical protein
MSFLNKRHCNKILNIKTTDDIQHLFQRYLYGTMIGSDYECKT